MTCSKRNFSFLGMSFLPMTTISSSYMLSHLGHLCLPPGNKYRTMAKTIKCQFDFSSPNFQLVSPDAIDFIRKVPYHVPNSKNHNHQDLFSCIGDPAFRLFSTIHHSHHNLWSTAIILNTFSFLFWSQRSDWLHVLLLAIPGSPAQVSWWSWRFNWWLE